MTKEGFQADLADLFMIRSNERNRAMIGQHRRKKENLNRVASMIHIDYESVSKRIKIVWFDLLIIKTDIENLFKR